MLSLEFAPEFMDSTFKSIQYLRTIGDIRLNYALGYEFAMNEWVPPSKMIEVLSTLKNKNNIYGDIYVQFKL